MGNSTSDDGDSNKNNKDTKTNTAKGNNKKDTKKQNKNNNKNDENKGEGFFGPFKWRVGVIGALLILFAILQLPLVSQTIDAYDTAKDYCDFANSQLAGAAATLSAYGYDTSALGGGYSLTAAVDCDKYEVAIAALAFMEIGLLCILIGSIVALVINFLNYKDCCGNLGMFGIELIVIP